MSAFPDFLPSCPLSSLYRFLAKKCAFWFPSFAIVSTGLDCARASIRRARALSWRLVRKAESCEIDQLYLDLPRLPQVRL